MMKATPVVHYLKWDGTNSAEILALSGNKELAKLDGDKLMFWVSAEGFREVPVGSIILPLENKYPSGSWGSMGGYVYETEAEFLRFFIPEATA